MNPLLPRLFSSVPVATKDQAHDLEPKQQPTEFKATLKKQVEEVAELPSKSGVRSVNNLAEIAKPDPIQNVEMPIQEQVTSLKLELNVLFEVENIEPLALVTSPEAQLVAEQDPLLDPTTTIEILSSDLFMSVNEDTSGDVLESGAISVDLVSSASLTASEFSAVQDTQPFSAANEISEKVILLESGKKVSPQLNGLLANNTNLNWNENAPVPGLASRANTTVQAFPEFNLQVGPEKSSGLTHGQEISLLSGNVKKMANENTLLVADPGSRMLSGIKIEDFSLLLESAKDQTRGFNLNTSTFESGGENQQFHFLQGPSAYANRGAESARLQMPVNIVFGQPEWSTQIAERAAMMSFQKIQHAELQLDPPELGSLHVKVSVNSDHQATVTFVSPHANVRDALDQSVLRLRELMEQQGVDLLDVNVSDQQQKDNDGSEGENKEDKSLADNLMPIDQSKLENETTSIYGVDFYA